MRNENNPLGKSPAASIFSHTTFESFSDYPGKAIEKKQINETKRRGNKQEEARNPEKVNKRNAMKQRGNMQEENQKLKRVNKASYYLPTSSFNRLSCRRDFGR